MTVFYLAQRTKPQALAGAQATALSQPTTVVAKACRMEAVLPTRANLDPSRLLSVGYVS